MKLHLKQRLAVFVHAHLLNIANSARAFRNATKDRMFAVEPRGGHRTDIKLGRICVRATVSHRECKRHIVLQIAVDLISELVTPDGVAAGSVAFGATRLDHEPFDHPVEDQIVVVAVLSVSNEVLDGFGAKLRVQVAENLALGGVNDHFARKCVLLGLFLGYNRLSIPLV